MSYIGRMMQNEEGDPSWFRFAATAVLIFSGWFTVRVVRGDPVPQTVWDYWLPVTLTLIAGAGGPRMVAYLAPIASSALGRLRGLVGSSYSRTEVEQTTVAPVVDDDPVKDDRVIM